MPIRYGRFEMPKTLSKEESTATDTYARFTAEPFEAGYGHTVGNSLRRVLLSSLEGAAITAAKITGAQHEKIGENTSYLGSMPYTDRLDYFCSMTNNWAYALSVEKLAGIEVPERAEYLRVILAELTRLQNHASLLGFLLNDMGAWGTPLMYAFREREKILDLFESLSGSRMAIKTSGGLAGTVARARAG